MTNRYFIGFALCGMVYGSAGAVDFQSKHGASLGYRLDRFRWNMAGENGVPNVQSELDWSGVRFLQIRAGGEVTINKTLVLDGSFGYGMNLGGRNRDSDYNMDGKQWEFSRSESGSRNGVSIDVAAGAGPRWRGWGERLSITPSGGFTYAYQTWGINGGRTTVWDLSPSQAAEWLMTHPCHRAAHSCRFTEYVHHPLVWPGLGCFNEFPFIQIVRGGGNLQILLAPFPR